jgi:hypothetical protein
MNKKIANMRLIPVSRAFAVYFTIKDQSNIEAVN